MPRDPAGAGGFLGEVVKMPQSRGNVAPDAPEEPGPGRDPVVEVADAPPTPGHAWESREGDAHVKRVEVP